MLQLGKIAITGGLSSGKSTVCRIFQGLGAYVLDADTLIHQLLTPESEIGRQVIALLGQDIVTKGKIDRSKVAEKVFGHKESLRLLENLLHPQVKNMISSEYQRIVQEKRYPLFVVEVPLLFEAGWESNFDVVVAIVADSDLCFQRFHAATGRGRENFHHRIENQWPMEKKMAQADYTIANNGSQEELSLQVETIYKQLTSGPPVR